MVGEWLTQCTSAYGHSAAQHSTQVGWRLLLKPGDAGSSRCSGSGAKASGGPGSLKVLSRSKKAASVGANRVKSLDGSGSAEAYASCTAAVAMPAVTKRPASLGGTDQQLTPAGWAVEKGEWDFGAQPSSAPTTRLRQHRLEQAQTARLPCHLGKRLVACGLQAMAAVASPSELQIVSLATAAHGRSDAWTAGY